MDWTDCRVIEQVPGRMSGAPVLRNTRVRPQDIVSNAALGADWIAESHGLPVGDVLEVLAFHNAHEEELPIEYFSPEHIAALGLDGIDWSGCPLIECLPERLGGAPVIRGTPVRVVDLVANRGQGVVGVAFSYGLEVEVVRSVLRYYEQQQEQLAPAV